MDWKPHRGRDQTHVFTFDIAHWRAWAPGVTSAQDWQRWSTASRPDAPGDCAPDVSFLPALQRRRLSRLARMAFHVAWPMAEGYDRLPFIFVSRHGETPRTFDLLTELAKGEPLSPTHFSLSVHNAVIGLWSILRGQTCEMSALSAQGDGLEHGLVEACALLAEGAPAVLVVVAEEAPPAPYATLVSDVPFPYAVGLLVTAGDTWQLSLGQGGEPCDTPHALSLASALANGQSHLHHCWKRRAWNWRRTH